MDISVINRLSDLEASLHRNLYAFSHLSPHLSQLQNIWKWGAVILALLASFSTIVNRIRFFLVRFRQKSSLQLQPLFDDADDFDSDSDDSCSEPSEDEEDDEPSTSPRDWRSVDEDDDFRVRGSDYFRDDQWRSRKFNLGKRSTSIEDLLTWSERSVVNLWENLGLGFGFADDDDGYDENGTDLRKYGGQAVAASSSQAVFLSAEARPSGRVSLSAWDRRHDEDSPVIIAEWKPKKPVEHIGAVNASGLETVYLTDDVTGTVTVGDMRKACAPLRS